MTDERNANAIDVGEYDDDDLVLTRRQTEALSLRERGVTQAAIADRFGTTRANVPNIEASARENAQKVRNTVDFLELSLRMRSYGFPTECSAVNPI